MKKTINNSILSKILLLSILLLFVFYFFLVSSFKNIMSCENGICNLRTTYLFGELTNTDINLIGNDFYCKEKQKLDANNVEDFSKRNVYLLMLHDKKVFKYTYKDSCFNELIAINNALLQNKTYSNIYEHFFINILYKFFGIILGFFSIIVLISKVGPAHIEIKTKEKKRKLP